MKVSQLSLEETQDLIEAYHSELKKIEFQTTQLQKIIGSLEKHLVKKQKQKEKQDARAAKKDSKTASSVTKSAKKGRRKSSAGRKKRDGRKSRKVVGGYRLSEWDKFLLDTLKEQNKALINAEIVELAKVYNKKKGKNKLSEEILRRKLAAAMHKLANKRGAIIKAPYSGKGFAYALPEWTRGGKLTKEFAR